MEFSFISLLMAVGAGMASIASPCVLPVVPVLVAGKVNQYRHRPLLIVGGLSAAFIIMGIISSLFGNFIAGKMYYLEKAAGVIILAFGVLTLLDVNLFKGITFFNRFAGNRQTGKFAGFFLGFTLGLVWIPCIGPLLSGILAMVATEGKIFNGIVMLLFYSIGFAIPMLIAGYASQSFRDKIFAVKKHPNLVRYFSAALLIGFGLYILIHGLMGTGF